MSGFDADAAARALLTARREQRPAGPLPAEIAPRTAADGMATQVALARLMGAMPPAGFKIGATAARMQAYLGMDGPAAGFMPAAGLHASSVALRWTDFRNAGVECEVAVRLNRSLPPGPCDAVTAEAAVGELFAAIEIVENRYGAPPAGDLDVLRSPILVADQVFHAGAVVGLPGDWRSLDLATIPGRLTVDGKQRDAGVGGALLGHPMNALAWLAGSHEAAAFGGLREGQVIMLGSVTPPIWLDGPCAVAVEFDGLPAVQLTFG